MKHKKTHSANLPTEKKANSPEWEEISDDLLPEIKKRSLLKPNYLKEVTSKRKGIARDRIGKITFKFLKDLQKKGVFEKTAWKRGGVSLYTHGLYIAAKSGRLNNFVLGSFKGKGTVKIYELSELKQRGIIPKKYSLTKVYSAIRTGIINKETVLKIGRELGYKTYVAPYKRKGKTILGHFTKRIKPK